MHFSLVIPAYDEADRIEETLRKATAYLAAQDYDSEIIVVDDGSRDETAQLARAFCGGEGPGVIVHSLERNRGKGYAVRHGMMNMARGDYRVFFDADSSTPIEEVEKLWPRFSDGADIVIGSRSLDRSLVEVRQRPMREAMGRVFNLFLRLLRITHFRDTQCGFKGFTKAACETVFPRQTIERFSFDAELLYIARKQGLAIDEVAVRWYNNPHSRVNPFSDASRMFFDLLTIRIKDFQGRYD